MDWFWLAACGLASGFLAGLLGIGGGLIIVPVMYLLLPHSEATASGLPQMAAATSLAAMLPTGITALAAQWRHRAVDVVWLRRMAPGVAVGALLGALVLPHSDARMVAAVFALYATYFAARLLLAMRGIVLPAPWTRWPVDLLSVAVGCVSVLAGVGGAIFTVPYLESRAVRMTTATGTSSGIGLLLSMVALASFVVGSALAAPGPDAAAPLVWWTGAAVVGACAVLTAPLGVRAAHRWPVLVLKRAFALLLVGAAVSAMWQVHSL